METKASPHSYSHRTIALLLVALAVLVFFSGLIINPWAGKFYRNDMINYRDVMLGYFIWAMVISLLIVGNSLLFRRVGSRRFEKITVLLVTCLLIFLVDRGLLAWSGLPLWVPDIENHFSHRPNAVRTWGPGYGNKLIQINKYGQRDGDFQLEKGADEFRGLMIGDSITMGHGVGNEETFSNQLEQMLREKNGDRGHYQIINAGVQGYSTFQEYNVLINSLKFKPDFIAIGFCMNDPIEPFVVDKRFGGVGSDYHGVAQVSSRFVGYMLNETGFGRLIQEVQSSKKSVELAKKWQLYNIEKLAQSSVDDPVFAENWKSTLSYLDKMYDAAGNQNIKVVLLIFPNTFQLMNDRLQQPQKFLANHAKSRNIDVIDFTEVFEKLIFNEGGGKSKNDVPSNESKAIERRYFLDEDHYTVEGHRIVASELFAYLSRNYFKR